MKKEFVTYEQALALKKLRFDEPCFTWYLNDKDIQFGSSGETGIDTCNLIEANKYKVILAPTYSQAFRWFREKYKFNHSIIFHKHPFGTDDYQYLILLDEDEFVETGFNTYEEAELACLIKLIEIVKTK